MIETMTVEETLQEAKKYFVNEYKRVLRERLQFELENEGDLSNVVGTDAQHGRYVDGSSLVDVDEVAYRLTVGKYAWRLGAEGGDLIYEALKDYDVYEDVDHEAIIADVEQV